MRIDLTLLAVGVLFTLLAGSGPCHTRQAEGTKVAEEKHDRLATGTWGGQHIRLDVNDHGASAEYDCAHSTIDESIILDRNGNFDVQGKYSAQHGGPIRKDEEDNSVTVRYVGHVKGNEMTLTITIPDKKETIGSFNLTHGNEGRLMRCL